AEPVDDPFLQVAAQPDDGERRVERGDLHEDAGDEELAVLPAAERATEDVGEQQDEHDRLNHRGEQPVDVASDVEQVAPGDHAAVAHPLHERAHESSSVPWPVNDRNTSSSVGRRSATSSTATSS